MTNKEQRDMPDEIYIQWRDTTYEEEHEFKGNNFRVSDTDCKYVRAQPLPVDRQEALEIVDELCSFFAIEDVHDAMGEWTKTCYERPDTGEAVFEHFEMTREEIEQKLRALNKIRAALSAHDTDVGSTEQHKALSKPNDVDVEGIKREVVNLPSVYKINSLQRAEEYEDRLRCIDHLNANNHLSQPKEEWRDIESAPKDGTEILITDGEDTMIGWVNKKGHCYVVQYDSNSIPAQTKITHWMPLPNPPNAQQEDK